MGPSRAEIARTLMRGRLPADLRLACRPGRLPVRQATDCTGRPLLLVRSDEVAATALSGRSGDTVVVVRVDDRPPAPDAPSLGSVDVGGVAMAVAAGESREAVLEYAETIADPDLFDVGGAAILYRVEVQRVRVTHAGVTADVDVADYMAADPDPLHEAELDLLADLADHHGAQIGPYLTRRLSDLGV